MTGQHFSEKRKSQSGLHFSDKKQHRKPLSIILSVIALIEILLMMASATFAWFEGITSLQMEGNDIPTASPLKSEFIIGEGENYQSTAELNEYFEAQANAKFTPVSSFNGEDFYALYEGDAHSYDDYLNGVTGGTLKFRELSQEEINSNLLYFQFKVTAKDADTSFWLKEMPTFKINGTALSNANNPFRIRIDDGDGDTSSGEGNLILSTKTSWPSGYYSTGASRNNMLALEGLNADDTGDLKEATDPLCNRANFKVFSKTSTQNKNGKEVLFTVPNGQTKTITIAIWLEALDQAYNENVIPPGATVDVSMKFCSSWDVTDTITFRDYTSEQWIDSVNENESNASQILGVVNLDSSLSNKYWYSGFTYNATTHVWTGEIPRAVQNIKFVWQTSGTTTEDNRWVAPTRGTNTTYTAFGSNGTGLWYDGDVVKIGLSDATDDKWLNNNSPTMRVNIKYSGYEFNYSMTDSPTLLEENNTWYCFIPADLDEVRFNRCTVNTDGTYTIYNYWLGPGRGEDTIYYALESGTEVELPEESGTTIYLNVPSAYASQFFEQNLLPAVSIMSDTNIDNISKLGSNLKNLAQSGYVVSGAHQDTWYGDQGRMTKISDEIYSFHFDFEIPDNTYITFWNKPQIDYNNLDNMTRMAPYILYDKDAGYNMLTILNPQQLTNGNFIDAYIFTQSTWSTYEGSDTSGGTTTVQPEQQNGRWGKPEKPDGTYTTYFVPPSSSTATTVTANFVYNYYAYSVTLTNNGDGTFSTLGIPDDATNLRFTDGTNTWNASSGRTSTNCYYVATSTTAGSWKSSASSVKTLKVGVIYYLKEGNTINQVHYWTDTGNGTINLADLTPTEKNYSVGSSYWSGTAQKFYCYEITVPDDVVGIKFKNSSNQWFGGDVKNFEDGKIDLIFEYSNVYHNYRTTY